MRMLVSSWGLLFVVPAVVAAASGCTGGGEGVDAGPDAVDAGEATANDDGPTGDDAWIPDDGDGPLPDGDCSCQSECRSREWACDPTVGLVEPVPVCAASDPCLCLAEELNQACICRLETPSHQPACRTGEIGIRRGRLVADDSPALEHIDSTGVSRHACLFRPGDSSPQRRYPLVVWMHGGGGGSADDLYNATSLRQKADAATGTAFDLGGQGRAGFFLLAVQGRHLHYPTGTPRDGQHHDFYHRDLRSPSTNPDVANLDYWIDRLVGQEAVDPARIYLMGWSNGCFFSQLYAFARHQMATPGGNRVAAVACYSGADPFENVAHDQQPSCKLDPYPTSPVPILLVGRNCDYPACDESQAAGYQNNGFIVEPGHVAGPWVELCRSGVAPGLQRLIIDGTGATTLACLSPERCDHAKAVFNHIRWPDGKASLDSFDVEPAMLAFLRDHPLP